MSDCYAIACQDCKKHLWIGQRGVTQRHIYTGMSEIMAALDRFLWDHAKHSLVYDNTQEFIYGWHEITPNAPFQEGDKVKTTIELATEDTLGTVQNIPHGTGGEITTVHDDPWRFEVEFEGYDAILTPEQIEIVSLPLP